MKRSDGFLVYDIAVLGSVAFPFGLAFSLARGFTWSQVAWTFGAFAIFWGAALIGGHVRGVSFRDWRERRSKSRRSRT